MDDWKPGDLALCVTQTGPGANAPCHELTVGAIYTVLDAFEGEDFWGETGVGLELVEVKPAPDPFYGANSDYVAFDAECFRKIHPLNEAEHAAEMRDLNTPVREPVA